MSYQKTSCNSDGGFVLVVTMLILVVLTLIGISATRTTNIELQIAGNEKWSQEAFYKSDGGLEAGIELIEQNLSCPGGFTTAPTGFDDADASSASSFAIAAVDIFDSLFAWDIDKESLAGASGTVDINTIPSDSIRSVRIPLNPAATSAQKDVDPHTNLATWGVTQYAPGNAIQMGAGYEGKGKGAAGGGGSILFEIYSQHIGKANSEAVVFAGWRHLINPSSEDCEY